MVPNLRLRDRSNALLRSVYRNRIYWALAVMAVVVGGLAALTWYSQLYQSRPLTVDTIAVKEKQVLLTVPCRVSVAANPDILIAPQASGWLRDMCVKPGSRVRAGDGIALVEAADIDYQQAATEYQNALQYARDAKAEVSANANKMRIAQVEVSSTEQRLSRAKVDLLNAKVNLETAQAEVSAASEALQKQSAVTDENMRLFEQGAISGQEVDQVQSNLAAVKKRVIDAHSTAGSAQKQAAAMEKRVAQEQLRAARARDILAETKEAFQKADLALARSIDVLSETRAKMDLLEKKRRMEQVKAPADCRISSVAARPGMLVTTGTEMAVAKPVGVANVFFNTSDTQASKFKVGMPATVYTDSQQLKGRIVSIPPTAESGEKARRVFIQVADPHKALKPGSSAKANICLRKIRAAIIPSSVLSSSNGRHSVWLAERGKARRIKVTVVQYRGDSAVVQGLAKVDAVIVPSPQQPLKEGRAVTVNGRG